jgi:hypothetical protein
MTSPTATPTPTIVRPSGPTLEGIPRLDKSNISGFKRTVLYKGESGKGKTTCAFSWPQPIVSVYSDPNLGVVQGLVEAGADIDLVMVQSWEQFADRFVPMASHRLLRARTIVLDSFDFLAEMMWRKIQGTKSKLAIQDFGTGLDLMSTAMRQLVDIVKPLPGKPAYNLIVTTGIKSDTDDSGAIVKIGPAIMGAFKDRLERYFNTVLLCDSVIGGVTTPDGKITPVAKWFVHTVPPSSHHTCKDSIGGNGSLQKLPVRVGGTYAELCAGWGCDPEPSGWTDATDTATAKL